MEIRARLLLDIVRGLSALGRTVVISSHILPELEELADRFSAAETRGEATVIIEGAGRDDTAAEDADDEPDRE